MKMLHDYNIEQSYHSAPNISKYHSVPRLRSKPKPPKLQPWRCFKDRSQPSPVSLWRHTAETGPCVAAGPSQAVKQAAGKITSEISWRRHAKATSDLNYHRTEIIGKMMKKQEQLKVMRERKS